MKICIVTPDFPGFINNGGIGTACYHLAHLLAQEHQVHVLYTTPIYLSNKKEPPKPSHPNITIHTLENQPSPYPKIHGDYFIKNSLLAYHWLKEKNFDLIHFQDWHANGFFSIQSKRTGIAFHNTIIALTMHSNSQWIREGSHELIHAPIIQTSLDYMERYCHQHCDHLISPSHHLLNWAKQKNWHLSRFSHILPYAFTHATTATAVTTYQHHHLIFFGRLETRKGIHLFCEAINSVIGKTPIQKITLLGKYGIAPNGIDAARYLKPFIKHWTQKHISVSVHTRFGYDQALQHIRQHPGILIIPSLIDNLPYTVIESIQHQFPFLAANTGGIPEMADPQWLFEPTTEALAQAISEIPTRFPPGYTPNHLYQSSKANTQLLEFHRQLARALPTAKAQPTPPPPTPKVSVCIPHYNHGKYLPQLLAALKAQDYPNFEVLIRDDGSTDPASLQTFAQLQKQYPQFNFYYNQHNQGPSSTRYALAQSAQGDFILFMDSDNLPANRSMIQSFVHAIQTSNADICTSHNLIFKDDFTPTTHKEYFDAFIPIGPCLEIGSLKNVFGDTNFIIKKNVFEQLGGFKEEASPIEDWEFLLRANLEGFSQEVIPEPIFLYRVIPQSLLRSTSPILALKKIFATYAQYPQKIPIAAILEMTHCIAPFYRPTHTAKGTKPPLRKAWHFIKGTFKVITGQKRL
jgi:glycosyltransferase involved in cell wall biosynthesis